jgi:galactonate dehydratase
VSDGYFALPEGPGLGVELDIEALEHHPRRRVFFDLYAEDWHLRRTPSEAVSETD